MRSAEWHGPGHTERHIVIDGMRGTAGMPRRAATADRSWRGRWLPSGFMRLSFELDDVMEDEQDQPRRTRLVVPHSG